MTDPRCAPLIDVDPGQIRGLVSPAVKHNAIAEISRVEGGLVNTLYRITLADREMSLCLRIFARGNAPWKKELNILERVSAFVPVPEVLHAGCGDCNVPYPYLVYRWIEGITLNECRRRMPPAVFLSLAQPIGRLLAGLAGFSFPSVDSGGPGTIRTGIDSLLSINDERLRCDRARERLGKALADPLRRLLADRSVHLVDLEKTNCLVHGDLSGRNILVTTGKEGDWRVSALLDWEAAFSGSALWDPGSLFRYSGRYTEEFRSRFERGYRELGGVLPENWWRIARLLDSTRLVETLNEPRELPVVFAECRQLIEAVITDGI